MMSFLSWDAFCILINGTFPNVIVSDTLTHDQRLLEGTHSALTYVVD